MPKGVEGAKRAFSAGAYRSMFARTAAQPSAAWMLVQ